VTTRILQTWQKHCQQREQWTECVKPQSSKVAWQCLWRKFL